jgi:hypothetical protein
MRLGQDEITISLASETICLRASLRAAFRLEAAYGGFNELYQLVAQCNVTAIADVIRIGSTNPLAVGIYLAYVDEAGIYNTFWSLRDPLLKFVLMLAGIDDNAPADDKPSGAPIPFSEYFTKLFRIATGWLGWTPEQAWDATPTEIIEAQKGRREMITETLTAIFGDGKDQEENTTTDIASVRDRLNALGNQNVHSMSEVPL